MENHLLDKKIAYLTLGCKVNGYETEAIKAYFKGMGAVEVPFREHADIYLINTCTVTNIADRKSRQMLHRARKENPNALLVATGCYVQEFFRNHEEDKLADLCVGNRRKSEIATLVNEYLDCVMSGGTPERFFVNDDNSLIHYENMVAVSEENHCRAYMKIQDGCNQFCSYCIIPFARGRISSRSEEEIMKEASLLAESGYREVVITGIHLSSYGLEGLSLREQQKLLPDTDESPLLTILRKLSAVPRFERIRLGSLEPRIMTEAFVKELSGIPKICPHFHLSLQSGCDRTLIAMNRKYTTEEFASAVRLLRKYFSNPALTTDIIVGFPGETEADFEESMAFAEKIGFAQIHIFPYSRRKGTVADRMKEQHTEAVKHNREVVFSELEHRLREEYCRQFIGIPQQILVEEAVCKDGVLYGKGHNERYCSFVFPVNPEAVGATVTVIGENITTDCTIDAKTVDIFHKIE